MKIESFKIKENDIKIEEKFGDNENVICVSNCEKFSPEEFKDLVVFDEKWINDIDTILGLYVDGEFFAGEKLDDDKRKEMIELASSCLKEISPIMLGDGRCIHYKYTPDDVFVDWDIDLIDKDGNTLDYHAEREENIALKLIEFIVVNNVVARWCKKFERDTNYPLFVLDVFYSIKEENVKVIMNLIKNMERQVFVFLGTKNNKVESLCDKVIDLKKN